MPAAVRSVLVFLISFFLLGAQDPPPAPSEPSSGGEAGGGAAARLLGGSSSSQPQAYDKVITKDAKSKSGLFTVHEIKDKYYYEIPKTELNGSRVWRAVRFREGGPVGAQCKQNQSAGSELRGRGGF
jgi:hypothetical protein